MCACVCVLGREAESETETERGRAVQRKIPLEKHSKGPEGSQQLISSRRSRPHPLSLIITCDLRGMKEFEPFPQPHHLSWLLSQAPSQIQRPNRRGHAGGGGLAGRFLTQWPWVATVDSLASTLLPP